MTLEEAVKILKERKHRGVDDWLIPAMQVDQPESVRVVSWAMDPKNLTAYEAIAIAEKYASGDTPASIEEVIVREWRERFE